MSNKALHHPPLPRRLVSADVSRQKMAIEYYRWTPVEKMPDRLFDVTVREESEGLSVLLVPFGDGAKTLRVRFAQVLAYAVYDDLTFALGDIEYGLPGVPTFIVRNYDWPGPHKRFEEAGFKEVTCYRFGSQNTVVDVLAAGAVDAAWTELNG